jgi:hypothetical protein
LRRISEGCPFEQGTAKVTGKMTDTKITWQDGSEYNESRLTLVYTGTMDKDSKIIGTVEVHLMSVNGDFTATPSN